MQSLEMSSSTLISEDDADRGRDGESTSTRNAITLDEMLSLHVGENGKAQLRHFLLSSMAWVPAVMLTLMSVFTERTPEWRCTSDDNTLCGIGGNVTDICSLGDDDWEWESKSASVVSEWDLVCNDAWKVSFADSMFFVGFFFGAGLLGQLADIKGRWVAMYTSLAIAATGAAASAASLGYWQYLIFKLPIGFGCGGIGVSSFVLSTEPLGAKWRAFLGIATQYWWASGICFMSGVAAIVTEWRTLTFFFVFLTGMYAIFSSPLVKESPRWLLISGEVEKAHAILTTYAKVNDKTIPPEGLPPLKLPNENSKTASIRDLLPFPSLRRRLAAMAFIFFVNSMVYYGLSLNVGSLGGSIYLNNFLSGLVEMPSYAFAQFAVEAMGRQRTLVLLLAIAGIGCLISGFAQGTAKTVVALAGRFGIAASFNMIFLYTTELFPTVVRSAALGFCSLVARVSGIAAPQIIALQMFEPALPFLIFGGFAVAACLMATALPETKGVNVEDTLEGAAAQSASLNGATNFTRLEESEEEEMLRV